VRSESEITLMIILLALAGIIVLGRLAAWLADRCQQPSAVGEICGGGLVGGLIMHLWPSGLEIWTDTKTALPNFEEPLITSSAIPQPEGMTKTT